MGSRRQSLREGIRKGSKGQSPPIGEREGKSMLDREHMKLGPDPYTLSLLRTS